MLACRPRCSFLLRAGAPLLLALAVWPAVAQPPQLAPSQQGAPAGMSGQEVMSAAPVHVPPVPLLWKISGDKGALYVLGSFHMLKPSDYPLSADVDAAFADAQRVVFELPPQEMASPTLALQMGQAAMRTDGTLLDSELSAQLKAKLGHWAGVNQSTLQASGITAQALQMFKPWFVGLTISLSEMAKMGLDPKLGLDSHFAQMAQQAGKPTSGLESGTQQIAFLDGMDRDEQLQMLEESLDEAGLGQAELDKLHRQWRSGDARQLWEGLGADMKAEYPKLYQRLNVERNDSWMPRLARRLQEDNDNTLLIVGALHTLGKDGIVEKLRAMGFKVSRICSACPAGTLDVDQAPKLVPPPPIQMLPQPGGLEQGKSQPKPQPKPASLPKAA